MATYAELLELIGSIYEADEAALKGQVRGRLQNLAKMGVPIGGQVGKGKRFDYGRGEIYQIIFCLELAELGVMPSQAAEIVKQLWQSNLGLDFGAASAIGQFGDDRLAVIFSNVMSAAWRPAEVEVVFVNASEFAEYLEKSKPGARHFSVINIWAIAAAVESKMANRLPHPFDAPP